MHNLAFVNNHLDLTSLFIGAMKEGVFGFIKGTGKGVLGLVFKPTGGLIDFTSLHC